MSAGADFLRRRRAALAADDNRIGLDFIEVQADPADPGVRLLVLRFIPGDDAGKQAAPARLRPENFHFTVGGGSGVPVDGLFALDLPTGGLAADPDRPRSTVRVRYAGDADVTRRLGTAPVFTLDLTGVPNLDPFFSRADFSLDPEVPLAEDCQAEERPAPAAPALLAGDYMAKDFASFRQRMLDHLAQKLPEWTERSPADLMVTLVELLADAADQASYFQDAVATEAYLGTARLRTSVRRHARLVGYRMHEGSNARVWVHLAAADPAPGEKTTLAPGTPLLTRVPGLEPRLDPESPEYLQALAAGPLVFETLHEVKLRPEHNEIVLYDWGAEEISLPAGATAAALRGHGLNFAAGDVLILEQVAGRPPAGAATLLPDADPALRHAVRLTGVEEGEDPLATGGPAPLTQIQWHAGDALPFALPLTGRLPDTGVPVVDRAVARGNVVLADHGRTVTEEIPVLPGRFRPRLRRGGLTHRVPYDPDASQALSATAAVIPTVGGSSGAALPALGLSSSEGEWALRRDLLASDRFARDLVVEMESDGTAVLRFGDGTLGRPPAPGTVLAAEYRVGNGSLGNLGRDSLYHVASTAHPIIAVRNPLPAAGGTDPESLDRARLAAPGAIDALESGSTVADIVALAEAYPGVERATATLLWTGSWYLLEVAVQRQGGLPVDAELAAGLRAALEDRRIAGWELEVVPLRPVGLDIALTVLLAADASRGAVERALLDRFSNRDLPGGGRGFFHPSNLGFGQPVYLSHLVDAALRVDGVRAVDIDETPPKPNRFRRFGEPSRGELGAGEIRLRRGELARVDNDPTAPQNGRIQFFLEGGR